MPFTEEPASSTASRTGNISEDLPDGLDLSEPSQKGRDRPDAYDLFLMNNPSAFYGVQCKYCGQFIAWKNKRNYRVETWYSNSETEWGAEYDGGEDPVCLRCHKKNLKLGRWKGRGKISRY